MTTYEEIKILEAKGLHELAQDLKHQPAEVITEAQYEVELIAEMELE
jgi:hypothetical protein